MEPVGDRPRAEWFTVDGGRFEVLEPAEVLRPRGNGFEPLLYPGSYPGPLREVGVLVARGTLDGRRAVRLQGTVMLRRAEFDGPVHPAIVGTAYVAPVLDALTRLLSTAERLYGERSGSGRRPAPEDAEEPAQEDRVPTDRPAVVRDEASGLVARVAYGRSGMDGRTTHRLDASVPADTAALRDLEAFVRLVVGVARRECGQEDGRWLAGRTYTLQRHTPEPPRAGQDAAAGSRSGRPGPWVPTPIRLDQLGGMDEVVQQLRDVADSFRHPEVMARWGARRPQGLLLFGPPGTGKTTLAKALAHEIGGTVKEIRTPDILDKWVGAPERNIKKIFADARGYRTPTVLLFDEFDSIVSYTGTPQGAADQALNSVAGIFKQEMNTLVDENPNVIVVATTNFPARVDESLIRSGRFDLKISVPLPDADARADILALMLRELIERHEREGFVMFADDIDVPALARLATGMSGADLKEMLRRAQMAKAMHEARRSEAPGAISQADLESEIRRLQRGMSPGR